MSHSIKMDEIHYIEYPEEIDNLHAGYQFYFKCVKCGDIQFIKYFNKRPGNIFRYKTLLCRTCFDEIFDIVRINNSLESNRKNNGGILHIQTKEARKRKSEMMICNNPMKDENVKEKKFNTERERNNGLLYQQTDKARKNNSKIHKDHPEWLEHMIEVDRRNNNGKMSIQTEEGLKKQRESANRTRKELYGCENPGKTMLMYKGCIFHSYAELAYYIYYIDNGDNIVREPCVIKYNYYGPRSYYPDFLHNGKIIEIKGIHFFKNKDKNNEMICPYNYKHGKKLTCEEKDFLNGLYEAKHLAGLKRGVEFLTDIDVKYCLDYVYEKYGKNYMKQFIIGKNKQPGEINK